MPAKPRISLAPAVFAGLFALFAFALGGCRSLVPTATHGLPEAGQLVLVTSPAWDTPRGTLRAFERDGVGWKAVGAPVAVVLGRSGSGWGLGLHPPQPGPVKREGDGRAPAGIFAIGSAFGYAPTAATKLPYAPMDEHDFCIDVPASPLYNRIVDAREVGQAAVKESTEPMRRDIHVDGDQRYRLGFVIEHNPRAVPNAGSCIFAHVHKAPDVSTAGCTAMDLAALQRLMAWLDPDRRPLFVLLPRSEHARLKSAWNLPELADGH